MLLYSPDTYVLVYLLPLAMPWHHNAPKGASHPIIVLTLVCYKMFELMPLYVGAMAYLKAEDIPVHMYQGKIATHQLKDKY